MFFEYLNTIKGIIGLFIYKLLYLKRIEFKGIPKICNTNRIAIKRGSKVILNKGFRARYNLSIRAYNKGKIEIGENCFFNDGCSINCQESIKIGNNVICGQNVMLFDHDHDYKKDMNKFVTKPIIIGNNVWKGKSIRMKKKVFFIMSTDDYSGAEAVNFAIIDELKEKYDFYWVSRRGNINTFLNEKGYNWIEIKELSKREIKRIINQYKPDILHATDYRASVITCMAAKKIPVIAHLHNNSPWIKKLCINSLALLYVGYKAKYILTVSDAIENEYIFSKMIKKKIKMVDNPISCEKILQQVKKNNQKEKEYDVCMTARLTEPKNPLLFIRIIKKLSENNKDIKALMIGDGELKTQCIDEIKKLKLENNIVLAGFVKNPYEEMVKAKVFCLTSQWEGFGLAAFEALTLGLPAVVSNVGGLGSIVDDECGKLCNNEDELYDELNKLLKEENYYKEKQRKATEKACKIENIDFYMDEMDKIYKSFIGGINEKNK